MLLLLLLLLFEATPPVRLLRQHSVASGAFAVASAFLFDHQKHSLQSAVTRYERKPSLIS